MDGAGLRLRRGEMVALLGPNGAGKSTTVGILLGLLRPDAGPGGAVRR
jgi:ABC-2 type transport system ATP-binding protein